MRLEYFQLIDRIVDLSLADRNISSVATVPTANPIFEGHFPGFPLMPGVLLIEAMAQTAGWLVLAKHEFKRMAILCAVRDARLRTFVTPGQQLSIKAHLKHEGSGYTVVEAKGSVAGNLVCEATVMLRVVDFPNAEMRSHMRAYAAQIGLSVEAPIDG